MPKLEKSRVNYSYYTKYKHKGDFEESTAENAEEQFDEKADAEYNNIGDNYYSKEKSASPTRWLSKQIGESTQKERDSTDKKYLNDSGFKAYSNSRQHDSKLLSNRGRNFVLTKFNNMTVITDRNTTKPDQSNLNLKYKCFNKALSNYRYNTSNERNQKTSNTTSDISFYSKSKQLSNSKSFSELLVNKRFTKQDENCLHSQSKLGKSESKDEISNALTKENTEFRIRNTFNPNISNQKCKKISPSRVEVSEISESIKNIEENEGKEFLDKFYASNGYFCYSATRKEMSTKDALFDRLQTFCDQRLLEIASQISVKQKQEEVKLTNLNNLTKLRGEITDLITENEAIIDFKNKEICINNKNQDQVDQLTKQINDIKKMTHKRNLEWYTHKLALSKVLEQANDSFNITEKTYQESKQNIRSEMHDDKCLIKNLEEGIIEAEMIINSLNNKAKFSKKLVKERTKMVQARSMLLKDLCTDERIKYHKNTSIIPSYLEVNTSKVISSETICSRIKHKLFQSNGRMRGQSKDKYTKRETMFSQFNGVVQTKDRSPLPRRGRLDNKSFASEIVNSRVNNLKTINNSIELQRNLKM